MQDIPKYELHLHLGGSYPLRYLSSIANGKEFDALKSEIIKFQKEGVPYHDCFSVFECISKLVHSNEKVENGVYALCEELLNDNVVYAEIRTGLKDLGEGGHEGYLKSILSGIERFQKSLKTLTNARNRTFTAVVLLSLRRDTTPFMAKLTLELLLKYRKQGVLGLDISGDSVNGDANAIFEIAHELHKNSIPITLHIGESQLETKDQQMKELRDIKPQRIGHAVHLHDEVRTYVIENRIPIEMCLSSALQVQMIENMNDHPALQLIRNIDKCSAHDQIYKESTYVVKATRNRYPIIICTDDPVVFCTSLSQECQHTINLLQLTYQDILDMQQIAFEYSFLHYMNAS